MVLLNANTILASVIRAITARTKRGSKYRRMWKLELVFDFICKGAPSSELRWLELMMRAAVLFMIFIPCRAWECGG
jgi:hypothetical protein